MNPKPDLKTRMFFYTQPKPDSRNPETCSEEGFPGFKMAEKEHVTYVTENKNIQKEQKMNYSSPFWRDII